VNLWHKNESKLFSHKTSFFSPPTSTDTPGVSFVGPLSALLFGSFFFGGKKTFVFSFKEAKLLSSKRFVQNVICKFCLLTTYSRNGPKLSPDIRAAKTDMRWTTGLVVIWFFTYTYILWFGHLPFCYKQSVFFDWYIPPHLGTAKLIFQKSTEMPGF
jgi:hypothetical protein